MKGKDKQVLCGWNEAVDLVYQFLQRQTRADRLLDTQLKPLPREERRRCQNLFFGTLRNLTLIDHVINQNVKQAPRARLRAHLLVTGFELMDVPDAVAVVVHHAVERAKESFSPAESRMVNAVARKLPHSINEILERPAGSPPDLALRFSHPLWLVERWAGVFGLENTRSLLAWNQEPPAVFVRTFDSPNGGDGEALEPSGLESTPWSGFWRVRRGEWERAEQMIGEGRAYAQDPSTRLAPELLGARPSETLLDLCAAPGGKSLLLAEALAGSGILVSLDQPGAKERRLAENMARYPWAKTSVVGADLRRCAPGEMERRGLPSRYDGVLLDAPCSNTGVLRRRVDARWQIRPEDIGRLASVQGELLRAAAGFVREGGRLVYSTCSIEPDENEQVVESFVRESKGAFELVEKRLACPWEAGHDGAGAFLLKRT
ncbi:MAG: RsmB/NOP family class I SAM-dependent RNA methyltransferase [Opitutales bacterium]